MSELKLTGGAKLRAAREEAGLSITEMAARIGYDRSNIHRVESNTINITPNMVKAYEMVAGHSIDVVPTAKSRKNPEHGHLYHVSAGLVTVRYCETCERSWILANDNGWSWIPIQESH